jgi:hypothetical protein
MESLCPIRFYNPIYIDEFMTHQLYAIFRVKYVVSMVIAESLRALSEIVMNLQKK